MIGAIFVVAFGVVAYLLGRVRHRAQLVDLGRGIMWLGVCAISIVMIAQASGCGLGARSAGSASDGGAGMRGAVREAVGVSRAGVNALRDVFASWDAQHQMELAESGDPDAGPARLDEYRQRREAVVKAFEAAYAAIEAAESLVPLLDRPTSLADLMANLVRAADALRAARDAFARLRGGTGDVSPLPSRLAGAARRLALT